MFLTCVNNDDRNHFRNEQYALKWIAVPCSNLFTCLLQDVSIAKILDVHEERCLTQAIGLEIHPGSHLLHDPAVLEIKPSTRPRSTSFARY